MTTTQKSFAGLTIGALGVVFGDIGTSPLYALQAIFGPLGLHLAISPQTVYGIISLVIWAITLMVSVKFINFLMKQSSQDEGGILALVGLIKGADRPIKYKWLFILFGLIGLSFFYGDSAITPAISVLSAVEGIKLVTPSLTSLVVPLTLVILVSLFWVQKYGTAVIGRLFGPVMLLWFTSIGMAGAWHVWLFPAVLQAISPLSAMMFVLANPAVAFLSMGAVVLVITGAEALYADMGHFGRKPISRAWFLFVFPALILCYLGQGAILLSSAGPASNAFFLLFSPVLRIPMILLATLATLIASQSVISGAFSLTHQAVQLDFLPRLNTIHTSARKIGQIYIPAVNFLLFIAVMLLVVIFGSSGRLANAYGIAVSVTLAIDTNLYIVVTSVSDGGLVKYLAGAGFLTIDLIFVAACMPKIASGGWFPVVIALVMVILTTTWVRGQSIITRERRTLEGSLQSFIDEIQAMEHPLTRLPGQAVYIGHHRDFAPLALHTAVEEIHELHEKVVIVSVETTAQAHVLPQDRASFDPLKYDDGISLLVLRFGFHDAINVPHSLAALRDQYPELDFDPESASYFISMSKIVPSGRHNLAKWRKTIYAMLHRNALSASDYYHLPLHKTVEMTSLIDL